MTQSAQCVHHIYLRRQVLEVGPECLMKYTVLQHYATYLKECTTEEPLKPPHAQT
jgi:hypothetical protein